MARGKQVTVTYKRQGNKLKPVKKTITKGKNLSKGVGGGNQHWSTDKAALASERISQNAAVKKAQIAGRVANVAQISTAAQNIANTAFGRNQNTENLAKVNSSVEQAVNGGLSKGSNSRDDDEFDSPWVD